jgi:hypothetical protein
MTDVSGPVEAVEPTEPAEPTSEPEIDPQAAHEPETPAAEDFEKIAAANAREAKKFRERATTAEKSLEAAQEHIGELQRAVISQMLEGKLQDPTDFDALVGLDAVLGEDGKIDRAKFDEAVSGLLEAKPHLGVAKKTVAMQPRLPKGTPVAAGAPVQHDALSAVFGDAGRGTATWKDALERRGDTGSRLKATRGAVVVDYEVGVSADDQ